jgi:hypothetical protein
MHGRCKGNQATASPMICMAALQCYGLRMHFAEAACGRFRTMEQEDGRAVLCCRRDNHGLAEGGLRR